MTEINKGDAGWKRRAILFLTSQCITLFGSTLVQMAVVFYVTLHTSSGAWVAACSVCSYLPQFLVSFAGGVWADRYDRKTLVMGADLAIAGVTLIMLLAMPCAGEEGTLLGALLAMSAIRSAGTGIQTPAVNAIIPGLVPHEQLMRLNGVQAAMQALVQFAAPAAAGLVLTMGGLRVTLLIDVITAGIGVGLLACVRIQKHDAGRKKAAVPASIRAGIMEGIRYIRQNRAIGKLLMLYGLFVFSCVPAGFLSGLLVSRVYGDTYGYLTATELAGFAGMMLGGLIMSAWGGFKSRMKTLRIGLIFFGAMSIALAGTGCFVLYLTFMVLYGVALTMVQTATTTLVQEKADSSVQGRTFGLLSSVYSGFLPLGMAFFGPLADWIALQNLMMGTGAALILAALSLRLERRTSYD